VTSKKNEKGPERTTSKKNSGPVFREGSPPAPDKQIELSVSERKKREKKKKKKKKKKTGKNKKKKNANKKKTKSIINSSCPSQDIITGGIWRLSVIGGGETILGIRLKKNPAPTILKGDSGLGRKEKAIAQRHEK